MDPEVESLVKEGNLHRLKDLVKELEAKQVFPLDAADWNGNTVLHVAAENNHPSIIQWVLSSEGGGGRAAGFTKVLARNRRGSTALHVAGQEGHLECCQALVEGCKVENGEREALLNAVDSAWTVLQFASLGGHSSIIRWLLSSEEGGGRAAGFSKVLAKDDEGQTALHVAAAGGDVDCCQALVEGCKTENGERAELLNAADGIGYTVLHLAASHNHPSIVEWLLSSEEGGGRAAGFTSISITAISTESALHLAGSVECLNALLSGCTVGERLTLLLQVDNHGWTVLHSAARWSQADVIRELLRRYPETQTIVDHRDHRGMTALHRAVIGGVDKETREEWRVSPPDEGGEAENVGRVDVVAALLTAPTKVSNNSSNKDGERLQSKDGNEEKGEDDNSQQQQAAVIDPNLGTGLAEELSPSSDEESEKDDD